MTDRPALADHWFLNYWSLHIVQQYPLAEKPEAWLFFQISLAAQSKADPFGESPYIPKEGAGGAEADT